MWVSLLTLTLLRMWERESRDRWARGWDGGLAGAGLDGGDEDERGDGFHCCSRCGLGWSNPMLVELVHATGRITRSFKQAPSHSNILKPSLTSSRHLASEQQSFDCVIVQPSQKRVDHQTVSACVAEIEHHVSLREREEGGLLGVPFPPYFEKKVMI